MNKCDSCIMFEEALKVFKVPMSKLFGKNGEPAWCRKCYQDEKIINKGLKLFIACQHTGIFIYCKPELCIACHKANRNPANKNKD